MPFVKSKLMTEETTARVDCGEWRLGREIGRGAYGVVYGAANGMGGRAAVKVCRRDDIGEELFPDRPAGGDFRAVSVRRPEFMVEYSYFKILTSRDD